ncbi:oxygenase MpaB family protein [Mycolicibacterium neoaurum]|uniref:oxygenase MpaB family protein n=1 Tax=Mycolicibacterium neoaurum TaxID=1795 RepID=UPI0026710BCF|nr:oxygenase MpaB family protein [Mycolicibacterium neoaurum]MDO3399293.1 oxygenase MpaB family protein [Mycolicibacterium neoaurum]
MPAQQHDRRPGTQLTVADTRIPIQAGTARVDHGDVGLRDAIDFWSFAGAAANVIMQMARPEVGYGVAESRVPSGSLTVHPWKRARTTTQYLAVAILGTDEERAFYRTAVDVAHRQVRSNDASPLRYNAFDRELQLWVAACLFVGFEDTYQLLHGAMSPKQAETFYQSAKPLGTTLQVTADQWPPTRAAFDDYWNAACERIVIDEHIRDYLMALVDLKMINWPLRITFAPLLRFLTIGSLAPAFRDAMGFTWSVSQQRRFAKLFVSVAFVNRFIPRLVRHGGSHVLLADVRRRLRGKKALI